MTTMYADPRCVRRFFYFSMTSRIFSRNAILPFDYNRYFCLDLPCDETSKNQPNGYCRHQIEPREHMHPAVQFFGQRIAQRVFERIDEGAAFVLLTLECKHHYVFDRRGSFASGRTEALEVMKLYVPESRAIEVWNQHVSEAAIVAPTEALIHGYFKGVRKPSPN